LKWNGYFSDMACSFLVGDVDDEVRRLWRVTREALYKGIEQARSGNRIDDISGAVQDWAESHNYSVIRDLTGHGIGSNLHEDPPVMNYRSREGKVKLRTGMTIAIEPMIAIGGYRIKVLRDGWTTVTSDGSLSAHFEHTILVTDGEPEILTRLEDGRDPWTVAAERGRKIG
ncbi:MAG: type I methionyl aminopeptidase, partial [Candidatus Electryoneaceae bacterium]|nr:type I methionyl aminopeptidase [Candidatus Electryoneaceae bacterium]